MNANQTAELAQLALSRNLFLAEALWSFYLPKYDVVRQVLESGVLGDIRTLIADKGEHFPADHRIMRADQAGGPMLDLGIYPVSLATWVLGELANVTATATDHPTGVHGQVAAVLTDHNGAQASLHTSIFGSTPVVASISGTRALLTIEGSFYQPGALVLTPFEGGQPLTYDEPRTGHDGLHYGQPRWRGASRTDDSRRSNVPWRTRSRP